MLDPIASRPEDGCILGEGLALPARRPLAMILFVGAGCRPGPAEFDVLGRDGVRCLWMARGEQALGAGRLARFDALVLDAAALGVPSAPMLARLREAFDCPLIMITGNGDDIDEIVSLELGATAYLRRPVTARRLRAHLHVLMQLRAAAGMRPRGTPGPAPDAIALAPGSAWSIDRVHNRLRSRDASEALTEVQCALLQCLAESGGRIVARKDLAAALPCERRIDARSVDVYMHRLRKRLAGMHGCEWTVETVRGRGYRLGRVADGDTTTLLTGERAAA
jgi:DNA-binding response OmpR family regulator